MKSKNDIKVAKNEIMTFILQTDSMSDIMTGINVLKHIRAVGEPIEYKRSISLEEACEQAHNGG